MRNTQGWFNLALAVAVLSGVFMSSALATRLYHNEMFWAKMVALGLGVIFVYGLRRPLLRFDHADIHPWALRLTAMTSLTLWLTVAACGLLDRDFMSKRMLEVALYGFAAVVISLAIWFWAGQVAAVLDILRMVYGQ